ncbi:MAG: hypothetical protein LBE37_04005 [Sphingobacterium sp.]|nr:hypothetical protein [Sphingobacterium sp.]
MRHTKYLHRGNLIRITYALIIGLLMLSLFTLISSKSPELLIQGTWREKEWNIEKGNDTATTNVIASGLREEILKDLELLHYGIWDFNDNRLTTYDMKQAGTSVEWLIKGRGHILELRREGKRIETFLIQQIDENTLELHLNFDLQVKGIMKIVLERVTQTEKYAKKI